MQRLMDCDYDDKYMLMYGALEQDFDELQVEATEATLLQKTKDNKLRFQTELKLLKRRGSMLRSSMRIPNPYLNREVVGEGAQYIFGPSTASVGRILLRDFQSKSLDPQQDSLQLSIILKTSGCCRHAEITFQAR
ncbi:hypothetical protein L7F22_007579, partial [Adiantum nelumboides]|nr:hypothetical protein [Adiantum nelumboides]